MDEMKLRSSRSNGNSVGLFPFPRVGRSDPEMFDWDTLSSYNSFDNYDELGRHEVKRQGLVPFPRVGRSGNRFWPKEYSKRTNTDAMGGSAGPLWFGPRLGVAKRNVEQGDRA